MVPVELCEVFGRFFIGALSKIKFFIVSILFYFIQNFLKILKKANMNQMSPITVQ